MPIDILFIPEWNGRNKKDTVIENPTWHDVEEAIRALNNQNLNDIYLQPARENSETYLCIGGGGQGRYLVTGSINNEKFPTVVDTTKPPDIREQLVVGGQEGDYPGSWIVDLDTALRAAEVFFQSGDFSNDVNWQNL